MLIIGISICISIVVAWETTKIINMKHLKVIDDFITDSMEQLKNAVIDVIYSIQHKKTEYTRDKEECGEITQHVYYSPRGCLWGDDETGFTIEHLIPADIAIVSFVISYNDWCLLEKSPAAQKFKNFVMELQGSRMSLEEKLKLLELQEEVKEGDKEK